MTDTPTPPTAKRRWLLTQNRELRREGIFNWTLPAWGPIRRRPYLQHVPGGRRLPGGYYGRKCVPRRPCRFRQLMRSWFVSLRRQTSCSFRWAGRA